jgi:hypothetical protein
MFIGRIEINSEEPRCLKSPSLPTSVSLNMLDSILLSIGDVRVISVLSRRQSWTVDSSTGINRQIIVSIRTEGLSAWRPSKMSTHWNVKITLKILRSGEGEFFFHFFQGVIGG